MSLEALKEQSARAVEDELTGGLLDAVKATLSGVEGIIGIGPLAQEASNTKMILHHFVTQADTFLASRAAASMQTPEIDPITDK